MPWLLEPRHSGDRVNLGFARPGDPLPCWDGSTGLWMSRMEATSLDPQLRRQLENPGLGSQQGETQLHLDRLQ